MGRLLLILAIFLLAYWIFRSYRKGLQKNRAAQSEDMVRCAHCGVHLPRSESLAVQDEFFCCEEHRLLHQK